MCILLSCDPPRLFRVSVCVYFFNISNIIFYDVKQKFDVLNSNGHLILKKTKQFWGEFTTIKREMREKPTLLKRLLNQTKIISIVSISDVFLFLKNNLLSNTHTHTHIGMKNKRIIIIF
jgi:hypothetical protein